MDFSIWTRRLQIVREFWHFGDLVLPFAVPVIPVGAALAMLFLEFKVGGAWHLSLAFLPTPLPILLPFALPAVAWWLASKPAIEGMAVERFLLGQIRYLLAEPRRISHFERAREPEQSRLTVTVFQEVTA